MSKVKFSTLDEDFAEIFEGTTLVQRHILCLTSYFLNGMRYNNKELGKFFQLSPERISHLVSKLKEQKFIVILFEQSKYRTIFLNENHPTLMKIAKYHEELHCCKEQSKNCLHCYFRQSTLMKTANSIKGSKGIKKRKGEKTSADEINSLEDTTHSPEADSFDRFWLAYPKHIKRAAAEATWAKLSPGPELVEQILAALEIYKQQESWQKDNGRFIPFAKNWLADRQWEDEVKPTGYVSPPIERDADGMTAIERYRFEEKKRKHG